MKSLQQNNTYQILKLRLELIKSNEKERRCIIKYGYGEEAKKFKLIKKDINEKLNAIEQDLKKRFNSLELTSENIEKLQEISSSLLEFKEYDETLLSKVETKITELTAIKENATKKYDFKTATLARENSNSLLQYYNKYKCFLVK
jgi:hypothetical protein